jgi:hypothetical protein
MSEQLRCRCIIPGRAVQMCRTGTPGADMDGKIGRQKGQKGVCRNLVGQYRVLGHLIGQPNVVQL